jgi:hypothetical protein
MERTLLVGIVLWGMALSASGVVVAGAVAPDTVQGSADGAARTVEDGVVSLTGFGGDVAVTMSRESVSARATAGETTVGLAGLGTDDASGSLSSPALGDGTAESAAAGFCAVGLTRPGSSLDVEVDGSEERVEMGFEGYGGPSRTNASSAEVVERCSG